MLAPALSVVTSSLAGMDTREVLTSFWAAMKDNDWERAAAHLAEEAQTDWPCTGERIVGRTAYAAIQADYPTETRRWTFDIHRLLADGDTGVSEVTVTDGDQSARVVAFSTVSDGLITHQVEYWPSAYEPSPERAHLVQRIEPVP